MRGSISVVLAFLYGCAYRQSRVAVWQLLVLGGKFAWEAGAL
jgi:hypothetical protein